jgi:hypothetical protein
MSQFQRWPRLCFSESVSSSRLRRFFRASYSFFKRVCCCCAVLVNSSAWIPNWKAVGGGFGGGASGMGGSGGRIWIFIATPSHHSSMSVTKHTRRCSNNYARARSRPNYTDDFYNEFEMCPRINGLLFPIGKNCRRIVAFTPRSRAIHLRLSVRRCIAGAGDVGELSTIRNVRSWHLADKSVLLVFVRFWTIADIDGV